MDVQVLLNAGFHEELGMNESAYRDGFPQVIPKRPDGDFPLLTLVEPRVSLVVACRKLGIRFRGDHRTFVPAAPAPAAAPYLVWAQDGRRHRNATTDALRLLPGERGLTAIEGVCLLTQHPDILEGGYAIVLPGSVRAVRQLEMACLTRTAAGTFTLDWCDDEPNPYAGIATCRA